ENSSRADSISRRRGSPRRRRVALTVSAPSSTGVGVAARALANGILPCRSVDITGTSQCLQAGTYASPAARLLEVVLVGVGRGGVHVAPHAPLAVDPAQDREVTTAVVER